MENIIIMFPFFILHTLKHQECMYMLQEKKEINQSFYCGFALSLSFLLSRLSLHVTKGYDFDRLFFLLLPDHLLFCPNLLLLHNASKIGPFKKLGGKEHDVFWLRIKGRFEKQLRQIFKLWMSAEISVWWVSLKETHVFFFFCCCC